MKALKWFAILIVTAAVVVIMSRNSVIKSAARTAILDSTGFDARIDKVDFSLFRPEFEINDLVLLNPEEFVEETALEIRRIKVRYDFRSLFTRQIRLHEVSIEVPQIVVVRNEQGETNFGRLSESGRKPEATAESSAPPSADESKAEASARRKKPPKPEKAFHIDTLNVKLGRVEIHDYTQGTRKVLPSYDLNVDRTYRNITNVEQIGFMISAAVMESAGTQLIQDVGKMIEQYKNEETGEVDLRKAVRDLKKSFKSTLKDIQNNQ